MANIQKDNFASHVTECIKNKVYDQIYAVQKTDLGGKITYTKINEGVKTWKSANNLSWISKIQAELDKIVKEYLNLKTP